jgi:hypothetical protein
MQGLPFTSERQPQAEKGLDLHDRSTTIKNCKSLFPFNVGDFGTRGSEVQILCDCWGPGRPRAKRNHRVCDLLGRALPWQSDYQHQNIPIADPEVKLAILGRRVGNGLR